MEKTRLQIAQVIPGMKLAEPITNAGGVTLMPAGIRLTPMFIARIKKWNIDAIDVFIDKIRSDSPDDAPTSESTVIRLRAGGTREHRTGSVPESQERFARAVAAEVSKVFVNVRENPLMMRLRAAAIKRLVAKGPDAVINKLRRGPLDEVPLPAQDDGPGAPNGEDA